MQSHIFLLHIFIIYILHISSIHLILKNIFILYMMEFFFINLNLSNLVYSKERHITYRIYFKENLSF